MIPSPKFLRKGRLPLRSTLVAGVAAVLLPLLAFGGWVTYRWGQAERALIESSMAVKADQVVADLDDDIAAAKSTLIALSNSRYLAARDFAGLHRQFREVAESLGAQIVLRDPESGHQIVNSALDWGEPLPADIPPQLMAAMRQSMDTAKPAVSNVFFSPVLKTFTVVVGLATSSQGGDRYFLSIGQPVHHFADSLQNAALPSRWIVSIVDGDDIIIARSDEHQELVGQKIILNGDTLARAKREGAVVNTTRFGDLYRLTLRRSDATGWHAYVGAPVAELKAATVYSLIMYVVASIVFVAIALASAFLVGGRLADSLGEMGVTRSPTREEFRILFESASNGVLVVDDAGTIVLANRQAERQFGYASSQLVGQPVEVLLPEPSRTKHARLRGAFTAAPVARRMGNGGQLYGLRSDGSTFPTEVDLNPISTRAGHFVMATISDVTQRVHSARQLAAAMNERERLRRRIVQVQEAERLRLAHELHDQTGQSLTAALLEIKDLESQLQDQGQTRARALRKSLEEMGKTLHRVAWELRPASIDEVGLSSALAEYVSQWSRQFAIEADFECTVPTLDSISDEKRTAIYRIVQEALTNVAKHAKGATAVSVVVEQVHSMLQLTIDDNGSGLGDLSRGAGIQERLGLGLAGVRERLALFGGELEVESSAEAGLTLYVRLPIENEKELA